MTVASKRSGPARTLQTGDEVVLPSPFGWHTVVAVQPARPNFSLYTLHNLRGVPRALKVHSPTPSARQQAERAARLQHQARGPRVLCLKGAWRHRRHTLVLEEWAQGPTLADCLDRERSAFAAASCAHVLRRAHAMACAVAHVHRARVLHRDIKPDNFQFRSNGGYPSHLVLADFGLARSMSDRCTDGAGTLAYQAPEVAAGKANTSGADVFSLGASIIEMVVGMTPYEAHTERLTLRALLNATPFVLGSDIAFVLERLGLARFASRDLAGLLCAMTDRDVTARPTAEAIAAHFSDRLRRR